MAPRTLRRLAAAADLLRPRTLLRAIARVDQLADTTRELTSIVQQLRVRTEQLTLIERLDWEQREDVEQLAQQLDPVRITAHVQAAVERAPLHLDPFPYVVVDEWLPRDVYDCMVRGVPPSVFFADREPSRQRLLVPFSIGPEYSHRAWRFMAQEIVGCALRRALAAKFRHAVRDYVESFCPGAPSDLIDQFNPSDGRIMLRRPGYLISPHRDPKWGFITGLIYLARPGDREEHGTRLYRVRDDSEAPNDKPLYVDESRCEEMRHVPFRANTMLAFLNSTGAHGASIPADAQPPSLERYVYQFRLGPDARTIKQLLALMAPEHRAQWSGAKADKADRLVGV